MGPDDAAPAGAAFAEAEKENPDDGDAEENGELNNGDFWLGQPEPNTLEATPEVELAVEEENEDFSPKPSTPDVPLLKELFVLIVAEETEVPPKPNTDVVGPLLEQTVVVGEDELKPKLNALGVAALELTADPSVTAAGVAPNLNKLDVGPPAGTREVVSDVEVEELELKPKLMLGVGTEPRDEPTFILSAGTDADGKDIVDVHCEMVPAPKTGDLVALAKREL